MNLGALCFLAWLAAATTTMMFVLHSLSSSFDTTIPQIMIMVAAFQLPTFVRTIVYWVKLMMILMSSRKLEFLYPWVRFRMLDEPLCLWFFPAGSGGRGSLHFLTPSLLAPVRWVLLFFFFVHNIADTATTTSDTCSTSGDIDIIQNHEHFQTAASIVQL